MKKDLQRILYIEDEADIRRVAKIALESIGRLTVVACASGEEAIAVAVEANPDLILLDVMMPNLDGPGTLQRLRELPAMAQVPVVFVTAKVQPDEIEFLKALGALDVISKPFDAITLADTLHAIWRDSPATTTETIADTEAPASVPNAPSDSGASAEVNFRVRMAQLKQQFESELPLRLQQLRQDWSMLSAQWSSQLLEAVYVNAHNLAGSGATFGYDAVTQKARALDVRLKALLSHSLAPDEVTWRELVTLFLELETELRRIIAATAPSDGFRG